MHIEIELNKVLGQRSLSGFFNLAANFDKKLDAYFQITAQEDFIDLERPAIYKGLDMQALSTSYLDYYQIFLDLGTKSVICDIGAGYCRGTFLGQELGYKCISIEIELERSKRAKSLYSNLVLNLDILKEKFTLPICDAYYLYLPWGEVTNRVLREIYRNNISCFIYSIESHGDFMDNLSLYKEIELRDKSFKASIPRHKESIYKFEFKESDIFSKINKMSYKDIDTVHLWCIKYQDKVKSFKVSSPNTLGDYVEYFFDTNSFYCCLYNRKKSLYIESKSRYFQYQIDTIFDVEYF